MTLQTSFTEADWEDLVLEQLGDQNWRPTHRDEIAPGSGERETCDERLSSAEHDGGDPSCF